LRRTARRPPMQPLSNPLRAAERGGFGAHGRARVSCPGRSARCVRCKKVATLKSNHWSVVNYFWRLGNWRDGTPPPPAVTTWRRWFPTRVSRACRPVPALVSHAKRFSRTDELSSSCARVVAVGPSLLSEKLSGLRKGQLCRVIRALVLYQVLSQRHGLSLLE
jgi:hypothetical protein